MSVTVGATTFDGATGTPTPPLSAAQLTSFATAAVAFRYKGTAPTGEGTLDAWADLDEADAQAKLREAGGLVGYVVVVTYPHGSIVGVAVASVTGEWQARAGTVNGGVLLVRFVFDRTADKDDGDDSRTIVFCQTAAALAGPWTTEDGWATFAGSDGLGTYAGEAQAVVSNIGPDKTKLGRWVRIVLKGEDPETNRAAIRWTGVVVGVRSSARHDPSEGIGWGASTLYRFAGIAHALAQLYATQWIEGTETSPNAPVTFQGASPPIVGKADVGDPLTFNAEGKGDRGDQLLQIDAAPAPTVFIHTRADPSRTWTALQAARTCIAQVRKSWPTLPRINLDELAPPILGYVSTWDVARMPLLGMLAAIMSPGQKRTFRLTVDWDFAGGPAIVVLPIALDAAGIAVDLTGFEVSDWTCDFDAAEEVDAWYLDAGRRTFVQSVEFRWTGVEVNGCRGFSAAEETAWDAAAVADRESLKLAHVARRFIMAPTWDLSGYLGGDPIPYFRTVDGGGQETGELGAGSDFPAGHVAWRIERTIPLGEGQDWGAAYPGPVLPLGSPSVGPLVFYRKGADPLEAVHTKLQVAVLDNGVAGIELGRDAAEALAIQTKMETDGFVVVATLSFVHPFSWRVSALATAPRTDAPRVGFTYLPSNAFARVDAMSFAIIGTTSAGVAIHGTAGRRDGGGSLVTIRDAYKEWYTSPDGSAEWRRRDLAVLTPDPGTIVASVKVTVATGPPIVSPVVVVGSPVSRRVQAWDLYNPGVTWSANRIVPSLSGGGGQAAILAARAGAIALGDTAQKVNK